MRVSIELYLVFQLILLNFVEYKNSKKLKKFVWFDEVDVEFGLLRLVRFDKI